MSSTARGRDWVRWLATTCTLNTPFLAASSDISHREKESEAIPSRFAIQVFGSKGIIEMETGYLAKAYLLRDSGWSPGRSGKSWEPLITSAGIGIPETRTDGTYEGGHIAAINDLLQSVKDDRPSRCSAEDCRDIIEMIAAVFESHRVGASIDLPLKTRVNPLTPGSNSHSANDSRTSSLRRYVPDLKRVFIVSYIS